MAMQPGSWIRDTRQYLVEVQGEAKKITWPAQKEAVAGAIGVVVVVAVITAALSLVDLVLGQLIQWVLG